MLVGLRAAPVCVFPARCLACCCSRLCGLRVLSLSVGDSSTWACGQHDMLFSINGRVSVMAQITRMADGAYRLSRMAMFFTVSRRVLDDAVPRELSGGAFGWMRGALPAPDASGCYLVEFLDRCTVRVLGYIDRQGGVFATNEAQSEPFESNPILKFEHFPQEEGSSVERGCVEISAEDGQGGKKPHVAIVAHYECADGRFALQDSWFDFGAFSQGLTYEDALARCFFAFVHRCNLGGLRITECGFEGVDHALRRSSLVRALRHIVEGTRRAEAAPGVEPPALVRHLARWLDDAHVLELALRGDELAIWCSRLIIRGCITSCRAARDL